MDIRTLLRDPRIKVPAPSAHGECAEVPPNPVNATGNLGTRPPLPRTDSRPGRAPKHGVAGSDSTELEYGAGIAPRRAVCDTTRDRVDGETPRSRAGSGELRGSSAAQRGDRHSAEPRSNFARNASLSSGVGSVEAAGVASAGWRVLNGDWVFGDVKEFRRNVGSKSADWWKVRRKGAGKGREAGGTRVMEGRREFENPGMVLAGS